MFSANPELAKNLYQQFVEYLRNNYPIPIVSGDFGEMMDIELVNDGPVTIIIDK
jgi:D-tyrosyl-tRNA(Tyr) deacylase